MALEEALRACIVVMASLQRAQAQYAAEKARKWTGDGVEDERQDVEPIWGGQGRAAAARCRESSEGEGEVVLCKPKWVRVVVSGSLDGV